MRCPACGAALVPADDVCSECGASRPRLVRAFADAAPRFAALEARNESGELDAAAYEAEFQELLVEDDEGGYWMFAANEGEWYRYESEQWTRRDPPLSDEPVEPPMVQPTSPGEVKLQPAELVFSATTKPSPATSTTPEVAAPSAPDVAPGSEGVICHTCGKQNHLGTRFCTSCGSNLTPSATPRAEPPPSVPADLSAATPARRRSLWVVLLMPIGWAIPWALSGWIGEMLSPWPISALFITVAGAIGGLITGLALRRTRLPTTLKSSASAAVRVAISWMIGWVIGWGILAFFVEAIFGISSQVGYGFDTEALRTATLGWAGIWGVTGTVAGVIAGVISAISLGRLSRRAGQAIEWKRVLIVAIGYPMSWILGWAIGGAVGAVAGAVAIATTGAAAVGTLGGAICGAICGGVIFRQYR